MPVPGGSDRSGWYNSLQVDPIATWTNYEEAIPAFVTLLLMPFTYSITNGIGAGFIAYTLLKVARGRVGELHPLLLLAATAFVVYFCLPIA